MNKIIDNKFIKAFYNKEISSLELAEIYFENKLYSAASSFYNISLDAILNTEKFEEKSYCLSQMSLCYLLQQKDELYSSWQLGMINDMAKDAIVFNSNNYIAWYCAGKSCDLSGQNKDAYYCYSYIIMNLLDNIKQEDEDIIYNMIFRLFDITNEKNIIKYDYFLKKIMNWYINSKKYDFIKYVDLMNKIYDHKIRLNEDEKNIINNTL